MIYVNIQVLFLNGLCGVGVAVLRVLITEFMLRCTE